MLRKTNIRAGVLGGVLRQGDPLPTVYDPAILIEARQRLGLNNVQLAAQTGITRQTIGQVFAGNPHVFLLTIVKVVAALGLQMSDLFPAAARRQVAVNESPTSEASPTWSRGPYLKENMSILAYANELAKTIKR